MLLALIPGGLSADAINSGSSLIGLGCPIAKSSLFSPFTSSST